MSEAEPEELNSIKVLQAKLMQTERTTREREKERRSERVWQDCPSLSGRNLTILYAACKPAASRQEMHAVIFPTDLPRLSDNYYRRHGFLAGFQVIQVPAVKHREAAGRSWRLSSVPQLEIPPACFRCHGRLPHYR